MEGGPLLPPSPNWAPAFAGVVCFSDAGRSPRTLFPDDAPP
ncbi:hypothetical protein FHY04_000199 [Sphingomonas sp. BK481]|nr:hypothetical protein [Sphingomonas sp. BK481]